jgi:ABC-type glycerol-3-phosphate transport system substrate-binding protein
MKKIVAVLGIMLFGATLVGCEKKQEPERIVPAGQVARMQIWTAKEGDMIDALAREFVSAADIPGLLMTVVRFDSDEILQRELVDKLAEGTGPDIILTDGEWIGGNTEKLIPLKTTEGFGIQEYGASFVRIATELLIQNDNIYGVPLAVDTLGVVYNEEHLIDRLENRNQPGRTWKEFRQDVESLTEQNKSFSRFARSGVAMGRIDNVMHGVDLLENLMLQYGTPFFSEDQTAATFASTLGVTPEGRRQNFGIEALKFFTSFAKSQYKNFSWNEHLASRDDPNKNFASFVHGDVSMVFAYPEDIKRIRRLIDANRNLLSGTISEKNMRVAMLPQLTDPENTSSRVVLGHLLAGAVPRTTPFADQAWMFLKFLSKRDTQSGFNEATGIPTARLDLITEQASDPVMGIFVRQAKFARSNLIPADKSLLHQQLEYVVQRVNEGGDEEELLRALETKMTQSRQEALKREKMMKRDTKNG